MNRPTPSIYSDLGAVYRPERVWAEGRAITLVIAHFLSGAGAGGWLIGLIIGLRLASLLGLAAVVLGGAIHLGFLGHPERALRMMAKPQSSWISRGLWSMLLFVPTAALYVAGAYGAWSTRSAFSVVMLVLSLVGMAGIFLYKGFVYAVARAVPLWHSPLLPVSYISAGLRGGAALALIGLAFSPSGQDRHAVQTWWLAATAAMVFLFALELAMGLDDKTVRRSLSALAEGSVAWAFFGGFVLFGLVVPVALVITSLDASIGSAGLLIAGITSLGGDLAYKYCMNTAATYVPLLGPRGIA
ncbi:MAG: polysulfide reductase NrfD [Chloroflexi bacterium]|nr:polysulfide reductase NrfD [Chloroflexota bacterium]MCL5735663.1 polysulfide reductase NrfD [Actinomycetota bacterium]